MSDQPRYRALLIGIDAYADRPLRGCVNDIDAVERLLLERAEIPAGDIVRLASPHAGDTHETKLDGRPATLVNIRAELTRLASEEIKPTDRVFIYYSGHGGRAPVIGPQGEKFHSESLVPVDYNGTGNGLQLLHDFEFNGLLAAIARRTTSVAVVLDCCHSTGATRDILEDSLARSMDFTLSAPVRIEPEGGRNLDGDPGLGSVDACHVVAACLNHELAREARGDDGVRHGLMTRAFMDLLAVVDKDEVRSVPWVRVWQKMRDIVETANPMQHLWMSGNYARAVLAGPPVEGDPGFTLRKKGPNVYEIDAGTLADVNVGARLAVYGEKPAFFPALGTPDDQQARVSPSLLKVVKADRATAEAHCESEPFDLPSGARARLVELGAEEKLRCAVVPETPEIVESIKKSDLLEVVEPDKSQVRLERGKQADTNWYLTDDVSGAKPGFPALLTLSPDQVRHARQVFELYSRYALPIRMATRCTDLPGQLKVTLLSCPVAGLPQDKAKEADLPEMARHKALHYSVQVGQAFCIHVRNTSSRDLKVAILNCGASGRVQVLGQQVVTAGSYERFWAGGTVGKAFAATKVKEAYIDRMVAIGTTETKMDLGYLRNDMKFSDLLVRTRGDEASKDFGDAEDEPTPPVELWTADQVIVGVAIPADVG